MMSEGGFLSVLIARATLFCTAHFSLYRLFPGGFILLWGSAGCPQVDPKIFATSSCKNYDKAFKNISLFFVNGLIWPG